MFSQNKCLVHHCRNSALSTFDSEGNLTNSKNYCIDHAPDPGKVKEDIYNYIQTHDKIIGLNANGLIFKDIDFSNKQFFGCNFFHCTFVNIHSQNVLMRMCIFDFSVFNDCNLTQNNTLFTSFSGCTFSNTLFTSSDMIQCNFNGMKAYQSSFDDSDLFNSRFINSELVNTSFRNCNLKKALFINTTRTNVSFKLSNTREAVFSPNENGEAINKDNKEVSDNKKVNQNELSAFKRNGI